MYPVIGAIGTSITLSSHQSFFMRVRSKPTSLLSRNVSTACRLYAYVEIRVILRVAATVLLSGIQNVVSFEVNVKGVGCG